jgi:hypothetical protein
VAKSLRNIPLPPISSGPVSGETLRQILMTWQTEGLAAMDIRNDASDVAEGIVADGTGGVTLGDSAVPDGHTAGLPTLTAYLDDTGRAASQRFMYPVSAANRSSVQSTDTILTATSGTSSSSVDVASHAVKFDFGTVSYNSGSIAGLAVSTLYYVYTDDPDYDGGSVTYYATTNPDNLIAQGRYYVGFLTTPAALGSAVQTGGGAGAGVGGSRWDYV